MAKVLYPIERLPSATNAQIVAAYERNYQRQMEINGQLIDDGFGHLRGSDLRANPDVHPLVREYLALQDNAAQIGAEADRRYGPGLVSVERLTDQGRSYRRVKLCAA